jgi:hypothetical protein
VEPAQCVCAGLKTEPEHARTPRRRKGAAAAQRHVEGRLGHRIAEDGGQRGHGAAIQLAEETQRDVDPLGGYPRQRRRVSGTERRGHRASPIVAGRPERRAKVDGEEDAHW